MTDEHGTDGEENLWDLGLSRAFEGEDTPVVQSCGRFGLVAEIARGGIGTIHRAWDDRLERDVAVKRLRDEHVGDPAMIARFLAEARVAARLQHPGVVPIYDSGIDGANRPYLCMKLVDGRNMADLLRDEEPDTARLLEVFRRVCETVAYAHDRGVIHRDLKPSNVMIGEFGEVLVVDWGFAKILGEVVSGVEDSDPAIVARTEGSSSVAGSILGTPAYMPPEQARGETDDLDERVDVFALGAILCEILTGSPPYSRKSGKVAIDSAARGDLDAALARLADCGGDEPLVEICRSCLQPDAGWRPRDAGVVETRVEKYFASTRASRERALVEAAEAGVRAAEERKLRRVTTILATAVIALVIAAGAIFWHEAGRRRDTRIAAARDFHLAMRDFEARLESKEWLAAERSINLAIVHAKQGNDREGAARIRDARLRLEQARAVADERARVEERGAAFSTALEAVRADGMEEPRQRDRELTAIFRDAGLDVDRTVPTDAARKIRALGLDLDPLVVLLDEWTAIRKILATPGGPGGRGAPLPDHSGLLSQLADALDEDGERARLRRAARSASPEEMSALVSELDIREHTPDTLVMLAMALVGRRDGRLAVALLEDAHRAFPGDFWINHHLSVMFGSPHEPDEVRGFDVVDLERALHHAWLAVAAAPESLFAREQVARALMALGRAGEADRVLDDAEAMDTTRVAFVRRRILDSAPLEAAMNLLRSRLRRLPDEVESRSRLAELLALIGDFEGALAESRRCLEDDAVARSAVRTHVRALIELGRYEDAVTAGRRHHLTENDVLMSDARRLRDHGAEQAPGGRHQQVLHGRWLAHRGRGLEAARVFAGIVRNPPPRGERRRDRMRAGPGFGRPPEDEAGEAGLIRRTMAVTLLQAAAEDSDSAERFGELALMCLARENRLEGPPRERLRRREAWFQDVRVPAPEALAEHFSAALMERWRSAWKSTETSLGE